MFRAEIEMTKLTIRAKSSSGEPYNVDFIEEHGRLSVFCNCKAGMYGQLCKHKTELIGGDESRLFDASEKDRMVQVRAMLSTAPEVQSLAGNIGDSEKLIRREQAKVKSLKKKFAMLLQEGIVIREETT